MAKIESLEKKANIYYNHYFPKLDREFIKFYGIDVEAKESRISHGYFGAKEPGWPRGLYLLVKTLKDNCSSYVVLTNTKDIGNLFRDVGVVSTEEIIGKKVMAYDVDTNTGSVFIGVSALPK